MSSKCSVSKKYEKHKKPVSIYVRVSDTKEFQLFSKTGFKVHPRYWDFNKGILKNNFKSVPRTKKEVEDKIKVLSNTTLSELTVHIDHRLEIAKFNRDKYKVIDSNWLKGVIQDFRSEIKSKDGNMFVNFFDDYIKRKRATTFNPILRRLKEYQDLKKKQYTIVDINSDWTIGYSEWMTANKYTPGYINQELSHIKRVVKNAKKKDFIISELDLSDWIKLKDKEKNALNVVYLDFDELQRIYDYDISSNPMLNNMKTILYTSSFTGLRFSDVHKVILEDIKDNKITITIKKKGNEKLTVPINPRVLELLKKNPIKKISNTHFNDHIGTLIKMVGINNKVTSTKRIINGKHRVRTIVTEPKYKFISSHSGRRSFCTNYYEKLSASALMKISGHKTSTSMLRYIGKTSEDVVDTNMDIFMK